MMGLPGSTPAAFRNDLQQCTDRDVRVRGQPDAAASEQPDERPRVPAESTASSAKPGELVNEAASFTRAEWDEMDQLRVAYYIFDNWGVLRYVGRYVRQEIGLSEVDFYDRLSTDALPSRPSGRPS